MESRNQTLCSCELAIVAGKRSLFAAFVFHVRAQAEQQHVMLALTWSAPVGRDPSCPDLTVKDQQNMRVSPFLSSPRESFPGGFWAGGCPPSSFISLLQPNKVLHQFITTIWHNTLMLFHVVNELSLARGSLTWRYLLAGLVVYLSDSRLLPSVRGASYPPSHMILQLAAQCLSTEDKGSSHSLLIPYFCQFHFHQMQLLFFNEATTNELI